MDEHRTTQLEAHKSCYHTMPNKGAGCDNKVESDFLGWFQSGNQSIIKEIEHVLVTGQYTSSGSPNHRGRLYLGVHL